MRIAIWLAPLCVALASNAALAHFLFVRICPPAEGGRAAEVYFSEYASAGDPRYIAKVATAQFDVQTEPGKFRPLPMMRLSDRLRGYVPQTGPLMVAGTLDYGALDRPGQKPFLLRHYSKAVAGTRDEVNRQTPRGSRLEIIPTFAADHVVLTALYDGKPLPDATFTTVAPDLSNEELKGDTNGRGTFRPESNGYYCVYVGHTDPTPGEHAGKSYQEIKEFATVAFPWPLVASGADPDAVEAFEQAVAARAAWQAFPGFAAKIAGTVEGRPFDGKLTVTSDGSVALAMEEAELVDWVKGQLESITMHRAASQTPSAERPKPIVRFADDDTEHPLGRLLTFDGGHFATSYRVRDGQLAVVNRLIDGNPMTITVLETTPNAEGKFLPRAHTVQYWDGASGRLMRTESVRQDWQRVGKWDLPRQHTVTTASDNGMSIRSFTISDPKLSAGESK